MKDIVCISVACVIAVTLTDVLELSFLPSLLLGATLGFISTYVVAAMWKGDW